MKGEVMKKFWVFLLIAVFSVSMLALGVGCKTGGTTAEETTAAATTAAATTAAAETTAAETSAETSGEPIVITVWDWQSGATAYDNSLTEINALYQQKHPNVTIERTGYNLSEYGELIKTAIQSNTLPDCLGSYRVTRLGE